MAIIALALLACEVGAITGVRAVATPARVHTRMPARVPAACVRMMAGAAEIQFIKGVDENVVPDIKLTRSKDGLTGTATFIFQQPNFLEAAAGPQDEITGMYMVDEEGEMVTTDVNAKFINGKPRVVEAVFIMRDPPTWDRVMRFLVRAAPLRERGAIFSSLACNFSSLASTSSIAPPVCGALPSLQERYAETHGLGFKGA